jgi:hypothetical protein
MIKWTLGQVGKTKPIQTQFKANTNPNKPNLEAKNAAAFDDRYKQLTNTAIMVYMENQGG